MQIQILMQQPELGAQPQKTNLPIKKKKKQKQEPLNKDMRAVQGRLARMLMRTARKKAEGDNYREAQT